MGFTPTSVSQWRSHRSTDATTPPSGGCSGCIPVLEIRASQLSLRARFRLETDHSAITRGLHPIPAVSHGCAAPRRPQRDTPNTLDGKCVLHQLVRSYHVRTVRCSKASTTGRRCAPPSLCSVHPEAQPGRFNPLDGGEKKCASGLGRRESVADGGLGPPGVVVGRWSPRGRRGRRQRRRGGGEKAARRRRGGGGERRGSVRGEEGRSATVVLVG